ncbi:sulfite exporter TauE/SafE family protein [Roseibium sp.]|uniref:sulfite exporter TauE/SafE family protein n=1 Tax=Roseibium sp. TaxID=1936156 RepID=UPI003263466E
MTDPILVPLIIAVFCLAGLVKGVIGLGLPTVALSLMTVVTDLPTAMALMLVPTFATNVLQALTGGHALEIVKRIWVFLLLATGVVWLGGLVLEGADLSLMSALLGVVLVAYALLGLSDEDAGRGGAGARYCFRRCEWNADRHGRILRRAGGHVPAKPGI